MGLAPSQAPHNPGSKISIQEAAVKAPTVFVSGAVVAVATLASTIVNCSLATHPPANGSLDNRTGTSVASQDRVIAAQGSGGINSPGTLDKPYVVLVSFDGFRYD